MLINHCVYSPTYLMLKRELLSVMLNMQNQNADPSKLEISGGKIKTKKIIQKTNDDNKRNMYAWITRHLQVVKSLIYNYFMKVIFVIIQNHNWFQNFTSGVY